MGLTDGAPFGFPDLLYGTRSLPSLGNYYDLAALTAADLESLPGRFPESFIFDGRSYAEL